MNMLSHYFADGQERGGEFVFGLIFPDLARIFNPDRRIRPGNIEKLSTSNKQTHFVQGIIKHLEADQAFHQSAFFKKETKLIQKMLERDVKKLQKYYYFYAHICFELLLDRVIIEDHPDCLHSLYNKLESVKAKETKNIIIKLITKTKTKQFLRFFREFLRKKYLFQYKSNEGLFYAFKRVTFPVHQGILSKEDLLLFEHIFTDYKNHLSQTYKSFFG